VLPSLGHSRGGGWADVARDERDQRIPSRYRLAILPSLELAVGEHGRCVALRGELGANVTCDIYEARPADCERFEIGSRECLAARARLQIS
jgi:hypothetical protein